MSPRSRRCLWWGVFLALLLAVGFAWREFSRARTVAACQAELMRERAALEKQAEGLSARIRALEMGAAEMSTASDLTSRSAATQPAPTSEDIEALRLAETKAIIRRRFGPLFHELALSPAAIAAVVDRVALYESTTRSLVAAIPRPVRDDPNDPAIVSANARLREEVARYRSDLGGILGAENFRRFERFQQEVPQWNRVSTLAARLYDTDDALAPDQARQLAAVLIAGATDANGRLTRTVSNWDHVFALAGEFLTPTQLETFMNLHEHDELWKQLNRVKAKAAQEK